MVAPTKTNQLEWKKKKRNEKYRLENIIDVQFR